MKPILVSRRLFLRELLSRSSGPDPFNQLSRIEHVGPVAEITLVSGHQRITAVAGADDVLHGILEVVHAGIERLPETVLVDIRQAECIENIGDEGAGLLLAGVLVDDVEDVGDAGVGEAGGNLDNLPKSRPLRDFLRGKGFNLGVVGDALLLKDLWLVSRICGNTQVPATCQVHDIGRFPSISES